MLTGLSLSMLPLRSLTAEAREDSEGPPRVMRPHAMAHRLLNGGRLPALFALPEEIP
jgi:hypothetical protein